MTSMSCPALRSSTARLALADRAVPGASVFGFEGVGQRLQAVRALAPGQRDSDLGRAAGVDQRLVLAFQRDPAGFRDERQPVDR